VKLDFKGHPTSSILFIIDKAYISFY